MCDLWEDAGTLMEMSMCILGKPNQRLRAVGDGKPDGMLIKLNAHPDEAVQSRSCYITAARNSELFFSDIVRLNVEITLQEVL